MDGILNESTETVHRHETGATELHTKCGASYNINPEQLHPIPVSKATANYDADKCGRCFEDAGGY